MSRFVLAGIVIANLAVPHIGHAKEPKPPKLHQVHVHKCADGETPEPGHYYCYKHQGTGGGGKHGRKGNPIVEVGDVLVWTSDVDVTIVPSGQFPCTLPTAPSRLWTCPINFNSTVNPKKNSDPKCDKNHLCFAYTATLTGGSPDDPEVIVDVTDYPLEKKAKKKQSP